MNRSYTTYNLENKVSEWFHNRDIDNISPYTYVSYVVNEFCNYLTKGGYCTDISRQQLLQEMCSATCTMYYYQLRRSKYIIGSPKRKFTKPSQWSNSLENQWNDYVHSRIVNYEFWENFWKGLQHAYWEETLHDDWRGVIQHLLPFYILREIDILLDEEIVCQEDDGNIYTWDDHEQDNETSDLNENTNDKKKK